jgi:hypothetical protein
MMRFPELVIGAAAQCRGSFTFGRHHACDFVRGFEGAGYLHAKIDRHRATDVHATDVHIVSVKKHIVPIGPQPRMPADKGPDFVQRFPESFGECRQRACDGARRQAIAPKTAVFDDDSQPPDYTNAKLNKQPSTQIDTSAAINANSKGMQKFLLRSVTD